MLYDLFYALFFAFVIFIIFYGLSKLLDRIARNRQVKSDSVNEDKDLSQYKFKYKNIKD